MLFAFCGKRQAAEGVLNGSLAMLPRAVEAFWLATADLAAGKAESAKRLFEELLPAADPMMRRAIEPLPPLPQASRAAGRRSNRWRRN